LGLGNYNGAAEGDKMWSWGFQMAAKKYTPSVFL
jgi:hypothetical protein